MPGGSLGTRFWTVWSSFTASNLGDGLTLVAIPLLAISLTDDARLVAAVSMSRFLPFLVVGLPAGVLLDRSDRRRVATAAQIGRATVMAALAARALTGNASIPLLLVAAFATGVGEVLIDGGLPAVVREVVAADALEVANARLSATQTVSNHFVGPPLGAVLFQLDRSAPFVAAVTLFLFSALALTRLQGRFQPALLADDAEGLRQQILVGLRYVWRHPVLRPLALTVAAFSFVGQAGNAVHVILATERFGLSEVEYGLLLTVDGIASVSMSFFVARIVRARSHSFSMRISVVAFTAASLLLGLGTTASAIVVGVLLGGISDPTWNVVSATVRQRLVPDDVFGRMMTAYLFVAWSMQPLGALVGGVVAEQWGPQWVYLGAGTVVGSLLFLGRPMFRAVDTAMRS